MENYAFVQGKLSLRNETTFKQTGWTYGDPDREWVPGRPGPNGHISQVLQKD